MSAMWKCCVMRALCVICESAVNKGECCVGVLCAI